MGFGLVELVELWSGWRGRAVGQLGGEIGTPVGIGGSYALVVGLQAGFIAEVRQRLEIFGEGVIAALGRCPRGGQRGIAVPVVPGLCRVVDQQVIDPHELEYAHILVYLDVALFRGVEIGNIAPDKFSQVLVLPGFGLGDGGQDFLVMRLCGD